MTLLVVARAATIYPSHELACPRIVSSSRSFRWFSPAFSCGSSGRSAFSRPVRPSARDVRRARDRVRLARTPRERAEALVLTAEAAARDPRHLTAAIGYLLRAMRADPVWPEPVLVVRRLLEKQRPHVLESLLWRRLAHVPWSGETAGAARCAAEGLAALYGKALRDRERAAALRKLVERLGSA